MSKSFRLSLLVLAFCATVAFAYFTVAAAPALTNLALTEIADLDSAAVEITHANDDRRFLVEQSGIIHILDTGNLLLAPPFLDIRTRVRYASEQGLLGLAFDPDYATNGFFYVNYINNSGDTVVARYKVSDANPDIANSAETILLTIDQPYANHNSGVLRFGPDGYLYISSGDGGSSGDPDEVSQDGQSLLGKLLRINVTGATTYTIPGSNPYTQTVSIRDEIWAMGLRNPWRFDFDSYSGDLWLADVGQWKREEVNVQPAGSTGGINYGWDCYEGTHQYDSFPTSPDPDEPSPLCNSATNLTAPIHEYSHADGCSIVGGSVYRGSQNPAMYGRYFFADVCSNTFWALNGYPGAVSVEELTIDVACTGVCPVSFGNDNSGELYVGYNNGKVYKLSTPDAAPTTISLANQTSTTQPALLILITALLLAIAPVLLKHRSR